MPLPAGMYICHSSIKKLCLKVIICNVFFTVMLPDLGANINIEQRQRKVSSTSRDGRGYLGNHGNKSFYSKRNDQKMTIEEVAEAQNWRNSPTGTWGRNLRWTTGGMVTLKRQDGRSANWRQTELLSRRRKRRRRPAEVISQQADQMAPPPSAMSASVMKRTSLAAQPNPCVFFVIERFRELPLG